MNVEQLTSNVEYELYATHDIENVKMFLMSQATVKTKLLTFFSFSVLVAIAFVSGTLGYSIVNGEVLRWLVAFGMGIVAIPIYIVLHEVVHFIAFKMIGGREVKIGGKFERFLFYTSCPNQVFTMKALLPVIVAPLISLSVVLLLGAMFLPTYYVTFMTLFAFHLMACSGDILIVNFSKFPGHQDILTYDDDDGKSYYYKRRS